MEDRGDWFGLAQEAKAVRGQLGMRIRKSFQPRTAPEEEGLLGKRAETRWPLGRHISYRFFSCMAAEVLPNSPILGFG